MPAQTSMLVAGEEPTYTRTVFEAILAGMGGNDPFKGEYVCSEDGVRVKGLDTAGLLAWHPWSEVTTPGSPNPLDEPWLRFPFTARQLAALMTDGWGYFIRQRYGGWDEGPVEDELQSIGSRGGKAKEVLRAAYAAYRQAVGLAPRLDPGLEIKALEIAEQYGAAREAAMAQERLREHRGSDAEYTARLARVNEAVAGLRRAMEVARQAADTAHSRWRRAVVQHLLLPIEEVSAECFENLALRALPPDRRAQALHQLQAQGQFEDSDEGKAHWDLDCEKHRLAAELRRWQLLHPQSITEAVMKDAKIKELTAQSAVISDQMHALEGVSLLALSPGAVELNVPSGSYLDYAGLATPDELVAAFGGFGLKRSWFNDLKSRQWLLGAGKVLGQGQRGRRREPLFCPLEVMIGLVEKSRKSRLSVNAGWRILEHKFPAVYAANSVGDPRDPPG